MQTASNEHPGSLRAQQYVANQLIIHRQHKEALEVQESLAGKFPEHTSTRLSILNLSCILGVLTDEQVSAAKEFIRHGRYDRQLTGYLRPLLYNASSNDCDALGFDEYQQLLDSLLLNPAVVKNTVLRGPAHYYKGIAYEWAGKPDMARQQLDLSYAAEPNIDIRLQQIVWSLEAGDVDAAQHYMAVAQQHKYQRVWQTNFREADLQRLQQLIDQARNSP